MLRCAGTLLCFAACRLCKCHAFAPPIVLYKATLTGSLTSCNLHVPMTADATGFMLCACQSCILVEGSFELEVCGGQRIFLEVKATFSHVLPSEMHSSIDAVYRLVGSVVASFYC